MIGDLAAKRAQGAQSDVAYASIRISADSCAHEFAAASALRLPPGPLGWVDVDLFCTLDNYSSLLALAPGEIVRNSQVAY